MALIRAIGNVGGGTNSITPDTSNLLGSITTAGGSFTAPQDCIMLGTFAGNGSTSACVYIGDDFSDTTRRLVESKSTGKIGHPEDVSLSLYGIFIPKGTTVRTRNSQTYNLRFYAISTS